MWLSTKGLIILPIDLSAPLCIPSHIPL